MEIYLIELLKPIELYKENCKTIKFDQGTVLKVIMESRSLVMVTADSEFNFTIPLSQKDITWKEFKE